MHSMEASMDGTKGGGLLPFTYGLLIAAAIVAVLVILDLLTG